MKLIGDSMNLRSWFLVLILGFNTFIGYWNVFLPSPLIPFITSDLGITTGQASMMMAISGGSGVVSLIGLIIWGPKIPRKWILLFGMVTLTIGSFLMTATSNYEALLAIRLVNGVSDGILYSVCLILVSEYFHPDKRLLCIGILGLGSAAAGVVGVPLTLQLLDQTDWQESFEIFAWISISGVILTLFLPNRGYFELEVGSSSLGQVLRDKLLMKIAGANILGDIAWYGSLTFLGSFLVATYDPGINELAVFYAIASSGYVVGTLMFVGAVGESSSFEKRRMWAIGSSLFSAVMVAVFFSVTPAFYTTLALGTIFAVGRAGGVTAMDDMIISIAENTATRITTSAFASIVPGLAVMAAASVGGIVLDATAYKAIGIVFGVSAFGSLPLLMMLPGREEGAEGLEYATAG
ncbi:MAG TPA: MFS transporter [Dehalococcoidia bacterium]|nr:MFS transporter [Dehalococcoidia bacterium]